MTTAADAARTTARIVLEIEAVHFRPQQPFILTSGRASPVYIDCRKIISFPRARTKIIDLAVELIEREIGFESLDAIAGPEASLRPVCLSTPSYARDPLEQAVPMRRRAASQEKLGPVSN